MRLARLLYDLTKMKGFFESKCKDSFQGIWCAVQNRNILFPLHYLCHEEAFDLILSFSIISWDVGIYKEAFHLPSWIKICMYNVTQL